MIGVAIAAPPVFVAWVLALFEIPPCIFVIILVSVGFRAWSHDLFYSYCYSLILASQVSWTPERRSFSGIHSFSKSTSTDESMAG